MDASIKGEQARTGILGAVDAVDIVRLGFLQATVMIWILRTVPFLHNRFAVYGARGLDHTSAAKKDGSSPVSKLLDWFAGLQVSHGYFTHFYIFATGSMAFWITQLATESRVFQAIAANISEEHLKNSMSIQQVIVCMVLMAIQTVRRLFECIALSKPSKSKMLVAHWLLGFYYYALITVAVWIEGTGAIQSHKFTLADFRITQVPSLRTWIWVPVFLLASGVQHDCHYYLSTLKTYTVPTHPAFARIVSPHYTAECVIYLSLAFLAAPQGQLANKTLLCALSFIVSNLGTTAHITKGWYQRKFGEDSVRGKWKMIPFLF